MKLIEYRKIAHQVQDDLAIVLAKHGLKLRPFGAKIDEHGGTVRMSIVCMDVNHRDESGVATTPERELFKSSAQYFDLKPEWIDKAFLMGSKVYKIAGLKSRGTKCVLLESGGKHYKATPEQVHFYMNAQARVEKSLRELTA